MIIHPIFILGLISYLGLFLGIMMFSYGVEDGKAVILGAIILGGLHWVASVINVSREPLKKKMKGCGIFGWHL
jgi:hypothetical protein